MKQIILVRHGESLEDINNDIYAEIADNDIPLTKNGIYQVVKCSEEISKIISYNKVYIFHGSAKRVTQSAQILEKELGTSHNVLVQKSDLLKKQDWGSVTYLDRKKHEPERYKTGVLDYKYPDGESGRDVEIRTKKFIDEIQKLSFGDKNFTIVIVCHGFNFRFFLKILVGLSDEIFLRLANPRQCSVSNIKQSTNGGYVLLSDLEYYDEEKNPNHIEKTRSQ